VKSTFIKTAIVQSVVIAALMVVGSTVQAQEAGRIAILDVAKVFKDNPAFTAAMESIKTEADQLKNSITAEQEQIKAQAQKIAQMPRDENRNQLEAQLEQSQTALRTKARQQETELLNKEAQIYFSTYRQMQSVVEELATQYGISLVLRFDSEPIDPKNRNEVIKGVNRSVVFHRKVDLTNAVTTALNSRMAQGGGTTLK
jgi:Skp family chaperone for outer membrane proteins